MEQAASSNENIFYVAYTYKPDIGMYFEQPDVIECISQTNCPEEDELLEIICKKNSCSIHEVELLGVFSNKNSLNNYLRSNDLKFLL
ncbi:MAG: hypothetical protein ACNS62_07315 [Candidatus Cyclobacteriaceae bacterium M3_2C_046]